MGSPGGATSSRRGRVRAGQLRVSEVAVPHTRRRGDDAGELCGACRVLAHGLGDEVHGVPGEVHQRTGDPFLGRRTLEASPERSAQAATGTFVVVRRLIVRLGSTPDAEGRRTHGLANRVLDQQHEPVGTLQTALEADLLGGDACDRTSGGPVTQQAVRDGVRVGLEGLVVLLIAGRLGHGSSSVGDTT